MSRVLREVTVIEGDGIESPPLISIKRKGYCSHRQTCLDHEARRVYCDSCQLEIDPFTVLEGLAAEQERYTVARDRARSEMQRAHKELEQVKRDLRNAKARLRRAG